MVKVMKVTAWFLGVILLWKIMFKKRDKQYYNVEEY